MMAQTYKYRRPSPWAISIELEHKEALDALDYKSFHEFLFRKIEGSRQHLGVRRAHLLSLRTNKSGKCDIVVC